MAFNTNECEFKKITVSALGAKFTGLRGFEFNDDVEDEAIYGSGDKPIDIQSGNRSYSGTLTVLKHDFDRFNLAAKAAGYRSINHVPSGLIVITVEFKKSKTSIIETIVATGVKFGSIKFGMSQGDKMMEVPMPFLALDIIY